MSASAATSVDPEFVDPIWAGMVPGIVRYDVAYPDRLSRWLVFVKWLLIIPHLIVLYFLGIAGSVVTFLAWFAILFTGNYPRGLWDFSLMFQRWSANVVAYLLLLRDEYPPFAAEPYPVQLDVEYPQQLSRLLIFVKWLLVIPHLFVLAILYWIVSVVVFVSFFVIIFTARYPRGLFDFVVGVVRWSTRVTLYTSLMTDPYPPFMLDQE